MKRITAIAEELSKLADRMERLAAGGVYGEVSVKLEMDKGQPHIWLLQNLDIDEPEHDAVTDAIVIRYSEDAIRAAVRILVATKSLPSWQKEAGAEPGKTPSRENLKTAVAVLEECRDEIAKHWGDKW